MAHTFSPELEDWTTDQVRWHLARGEGQTAHLARSIASLAPEGVEYEPLARLVDRVLRRLRLAGQANYCTRSRAWKLKPFGLDVATAICPPPVPDPRTSEPETT